MDVKALETSLLFQNVTSTDVTAALKRTPHQVKTYKAGQTIFRQLDKASRVGVVIEGSVKEEKVFPDGSYVNEMVREIGETVGVGAAFDAYAKYPSNVVALEPTTLLLIKRDDFLKLVHSDIRLLENVMKEIAASTAALQQRIELFSYSGIAQKAAFWLLTKQRETENMVVEVPESMTNWASLMKVSRPSLHREISKMAEQGMISYSPREIEILDEESLEMLLGV